LRRLLFCFVLILSTLTVFAQQTNTLDTADRFQVKHFALLPDRGYTFQQILSDSTLRFTSNDSLEYGTVYWIKIIVANPFHHAEQFNIGINPYLDNTWYYFNADDQKWISHRTGIYTVRYNERRNNWILSYTIQGQTVSTIYVKSDIRALLNHNLRPVITFEKHSSAIGKEEVLWVGWVCGLSVLFLFFLNNLYIYSSFRDLTVLYYLHAQLGAIIYIIAYRQFFHVLFLRHIFKIGPDGNGLLMHYDFNNLMMHIGVILLLYGLIQQTRSYLNTKQSLASLDMLLRYGFYVYLIFSSVLIGINTSLRYVESNTLVMDNIIVLALIALIIATCVVAYVRKLPASGTLLLANLAPLVLILTASFFHVFFDLDDNINLLIPTLAIVFQSLSFSIALVARTKSIQHNLIRKEKEALQLESDLTDLEVRQKEIEEENQKINSEILDEKSRNELMHEKLETNQRELASTALYIVHKNKLLSGLKTQIRELNKLNPENDPDGLRELNSILQSSRSLDDDWGKFVLHFEQVHPLFFQNAREQYPSLTKNELRLYAYSHINLSNKEIATMLNIDPGSVRRAKTRLSKKLATNDGENLTRPE